MKLSDKIYRFRKWITDIETALSGNLKKVFKRFFVRKPMHKKFVEFLRKF
jgi:hypothetical protein